MTLVCCLCLYAETGQAGEAVTIINGQAVCDYHHGFVHGEPFTSFLWVAERNVRQASPLNEADNQKGGK